MLNATLRINPISRITLLFALTLFTITNTGCASSENTTTKDWQQTVILRKNKSAWLRVDSNFAKIIIINEGPANLKIRIPAAGSPIFDEVTLPPKQTYRDLFFDTRSITFTNNDPRRQTIFHYQIKGDPMTVNFHQPQANPTNP